MNEKVLVWLSAGIVVLIGAAYMVWLVVVFMKFNETDKYVREHIDEFYSRVPTSRDTVDAEVVPDDAP